MNIFMYALRLRSATPLCGVADVDGSSKPLVRQDHSRFRTQPATPHLSTTPIRRPGSLPFRPLTTYHSPCVEPLPHISNRCPLSGTHEMHRASWTQDLWFGFAKSNIPNRF